MLVLTLLYPTGDSVEHTHLVLKWHHPSRLHVAVPHERARLAIWLRTRPAHTVRRELHAVCVWLLGWLEGLSIDSGPVKSRSRRRMRSRRLVTIGQRRLFACRTAFVRFRWKLLLPRG